MDLGSLKENENCEETHASFRIIGETLQPSEVTKALGLEPAYGHVKGEKFVTRTGEHERITGIWILKSETFVDSTSLEKHLLFLLTKLEPVSGCIREYVKDPDYYVDFLCAWTSSSGHGGPLLSAECLSRLGKLCNELSFDYYGLYDD